MEFTDARRDGSVRTFEAQLASDLRCWPWQCRLEKVALGYRLPMFVLPCPDYAISRFGAELEAGGQGVWFRR